MTRSDSSTARVYVAFDDTDTTDATGITVVSIDRDAQSASPVASQSR